MRWDEVCIYLCVCLEYIWCWKYHAEMDVDARKMPSILHCIRCILCARHLWAAFKRFTVHRIDSFYALFSSVCVLFSFGFSKSILRFPTASFSLPLTFSLSLFLTFNSMFHCKMIYELCCAFGVCNCYDWSTVSNSFRFDGISRSVCGMWLVLSMMYTASRWKIRFVSLFPEKILCLMECVPRIQDHELMDMVIAWLNNWTSTSLHVHFENELFTFYRTTCRLIIIPAKLLW